MENDTPDDHLAKVGHADMTEQMQTLARSPQILVDHLSNQTEGLHEHAPNIVQSIHTAAMNGLSFLQSKIPKPTDKLPFSDQKWEPSIGQKEKFATYFGAVNDPVGVLKEVKNGTLTSEHMEALQAVHPELLEQMRKSVIGAFDQAKDQNIPYGRKIALAKFLGHPLDSHMSPQAIMQAQNALAMPAQTNQMTAPTGKRARAAIGKIGLAQRNMTETRADEEPQRG